MTTFAVHSEQAVPDKPVERLEKMNFPFEIVKWNNQMRELRISELPVESQLYLEDYIPRYIPSNKSVVTLFDVFDAEEGRI